MKQLSFAEKYGPWALVTGGASGIGAEFCSQLADRGINLVLVDIQKEMMLEHAKSLKERFGIDVITVTADLAAPAFMKKLRRASAGTEIGLLVNNAAWGSVGEFMKADRDELLRTIAVNCRAPMELAREYGPAMVARGRGGIIFLSSCAALQVTPILANYAASKSYNLILAEALWDELSHDGVDVLALCPGATNTPAFHKSGARIENLSGMPIMESEQVVAEALASLGNRPRFIPGRVNRVATYVLTSLMSRKKSVAFSGENMRKLYSIK